MPTGRSSTTPASTPPEGAKTISDSKRPKQTRTSESDNKLEGFIEVIEELHKFIKDTRAKGREEAIAKAEGLIHDMRVHYAVQEIQASISQQIQDQFQVLQSNLTAKTWAQVTATPPLPTGKPKISTEKRQETESTRKQRAEYEITLTATASPTEVKDAIKTYHPHAIMEECQKAIEDAKLQGQPMVRSINKLGAHNIRLIFKTTEAAKTVRDADINWSKAFPGLATHKPKYGIVVHAVPVEAIDLNGDHKDTIQEWESENLGKGLKIIRVTTLRRQEKHRPSPHRSIIVFTEDQNAANECLKMGFFIDRERFKTEKYAPHLHINQCFRCHGFGHRATQCKKQERCGKCSDSKHKTTECQETEGLKCVNCKGKHAAWSVDCPARTEESTRLTQMRLEASSFFA